MGVLTLEIAAIYHTNVRIQRTGVTSEGGLVMIRFRGVLSLLLLGVMVTLLAPPVFAHAGTQDTPTYALPFLWEHDINSQ